MTEIKAKNLNIGNHVKQVGDIVVSYGCASKELSQLFSEIESAMCQAKLSVGEREEADQYLATIKEEVLQKQQPRRYMMKTAYEGLKKIAANGDFLSIVEKLSPIISTIIQK